jgi:hypothetical protein
VIIFEHAQATSFQPNKFAQPRPACFPDHHGHVVLFNLFLSNTNSQIPSIHSKAKTVLGGMISDLSAVGSGGLKRKQIEIDVDPEGMLSVVALVGMICLGDTMLFFLANAK